MPRSYQAASSEHRLLSTLSAPLCYDVIRLLEPLGHPQDGRAIPHVLAALQMALRQLNSTIPGGNKALNALVQLADQALCAGVTSTGESTPVVLGKEVSLWPILSALEPSAASPELLSLIGATYLVIFTGRQRPAQPVFELLLEAVLATNRPAHPDSGARINAALIRGARVLAQARKDLQADAVLSTSAATTIQEARIERQMIGAFRHDDPHSMAGLVRQRGLTAQDVIDTAVAVRSQAEAGSAEALVVALGHWLGVSPVDMPDLALFADQPGLIRISGDCGHALIDLRGVLSELASSPFPGVSPSQDVLILPLPHWISAVLHRLRLSAPCARTLTDLAGDLRGARSFAPFPDGQAGSKRITGQKFVIDRALPLLRAEMDNARGAIASVNFGLIHKVSGPYQRITADEVLDATQQRSCLLGWGPLHPQMRRDHGYLSRVTPQIESVKDIVRQLNEALERTRPGPNAGSAPLVEHHNHFIRYVSFVFALCLALRGQETHLPPASWMQPGREWIYFTDKDDGHPRRTTPPIALGLSLRKQLQLLKAHYGAMARRLQKRLHGCGAVDPNCIGTLRSLESGSQEQPLLMAFDGTRLLCYSQLSLVRDLRPVWAGKADALRHLVHDILREAGADYINREVTLRHVGGAEQITANASAWSRGDWLQEAGRSQEVLLQAVGLHPKVGLARSPTIGNARIRG